MLISIGWCRSVVLVVCFSNVDEFERKPRINLYKCVVWKPDRAAAVWLVNDVHSVLGAAGQERKQARRRTRR